MEKHKVELYIYDLSKGMAKTLAPLLIGKSLDGIWHTSIVVYNREYFFNSGGIENCMPGSTQLGKPLKVEVLGYTEVPYSVFADYITSLKESTFSGTSYNLLENNCNSFSEEVAQFLVNKSIPKYILDLPNEVLSSNLPPQILALLNSFEQNARVVNPELSQREESPSYEQLNNQIEEARLASKSVNNKLIGKSKRLHD